MGCAGALPRLQAILDAGAKPDFLEFHYSYKDLDMDVDEVFAAYKDNPLPMGYTCHLPDLFSGDFILDLASPDDAVWERSIRELQRTIDITKSLRPYFTQEEDPVFIATLGGFTKEARLTLSKSRPCMTASLRV